MLYTRFHAIRKRWLLVRMTVIGAVLAGLVPLNGQQPQQRAGSATQDPSPACDPRSPQNPISSPASSAKNDPNAEVTVQDSGTTFRLPVNLVQVHVVVRDANNNPVANLKQEDFQLFDQGKLQPISLFTMETRETRREKAEAAVLTHTSEMELTNGSKTVLPDRFTASQQLNVTFTNDKAALQRALRHAMALWIYRIEEHAVRSRGRFQ
jgi:hypothetical protein